MKRKSILVWTLLLVIFGGIFVVPQAVAEQIAWEKPEPPGKWYKLSAGYFIIWYEEKDKAIAEELAQVGQSMYRDYKDIFGPKSPSKVYIKIEGRAGASNGAYANSPPHIIFYPTSAGLDTKGYNWNYFLLSHEFLHYIHLEYRGGLIGALTYIFGPVVRGYGNLPMPLWGAEGFATSIESAYTSVGRSYHPVFTMPYRADILLDNTDSYLAITRMRDIDDLAHYGKRYLYGVQLFDYMKEKYGYKATAEAYQRFTRFPLFYRERYKKATGVKLNTIYNLMIMDSQKRYAKFKDWKRGTEINGGKKKFSRMAVMDGTDNGALIYQMGSDEKSQYMLFDSKTNTLEPLFYAVGNSADLFIGQYAAITRDESTVVYAESVVNIDMLNGGGGAIGKYNDLFLYETSRKKRTRLTKKQQITTPSITDDGQYVYATQLTHSGNYGRLIKINTATPKQGYEIIYESDQSMVFYKDVSPDGNKIVFVERGPKIGVMLQLLDINTKEVHTLLQRDYGITITSPQFVDDNNITISADLEYSTDNSELYQIDISNIEAPVWMKVAQDMVGFHSAVLDGEGNVVYSSHNSRAFVIFYYKNNQLLNTPIELASIPIPDFYQDNDLQLHLDKTVIDDPSKARPRRPIIPEKPVPMKTRRALSAFPLRPSAYYPMISFGDMPEIKGNTQFNGGNDRSVLNTSLGYNFTAKGISYALAYDYAFPRIGKVGIISAKKFASTFQNTLTSGTDFFQNIYLQSLSYSRPILYTANYFHLSIEESNTFYSRTLIDNEGVTQYRIGNSIDFSLSLPFGWSKKLFANTYLTNDFSWKIAPGMQFTPALLDMDTQTIEVNNTSFISIPVVKRLNLKLSNYSFWILGGLGYKNTERLHRFKNLAEFAVLPSVNTLKDGKGSTGHPFQSSFAFDVLMPWTNLNVGSHIFNPSLFYTNVFVEQTVGYNFDLQKFDINKYLIAGLETGTSINVLVFQLDFKVGVSYKIPYDDTADAGSYYYFAVGQGVLSDTNGLKERW